MEEKNGKLDFIKMKDFSSHYQRMKTQATDWEKKKFINLIENLYPDYIKNSENLRKQTHFKKQAKDFNRPL